MKISKSEFTSELSQRTGLTKKNSSEVVQAFLDIVKDELAKGNEIRFIGFGKFSVVDREERKGHNPQTGKEITIPAHKVIAFHAGKDLKGSVK